MDLNLPTSSLWDAAAANANLRFPSSAVNLYDKLTKKVINQVITTHSWYIYIYIYIFNLQLNKIKNSALPRTY
jgi:hypothetical protein